MRPRWKIILLLTAILLLAFSVAVAWSTPQNASAPTFSAKDRDAIQAFYLRLIGTLAPGSINRTPFSLDIEKALAVGSHVPMQFEKNLAPLPAELETKLVPLTGATDVSTATRPAASPPTAGTGYGTSFLRPGEAEARWRSRSSRRFAVDQSRSPALGRPPADREGRDKRA